MTQEHLSIVAGILCLVITAFLSGLHVVSSQKRDRWMDFPNYVRVGIMALIVMSLYRGIQFLTPVPIPPADSVATIQAEGLIFLAVLAYTIGSISLWVARRHLPPNVWPRLSWIETEERADPNKVPVLMSMDEVVDAARLMGIKAVAPGAGPHEINDPPRGA